MDNGSSRRPCPFLGLGKKVEDEERRREGGWEGRESQKYKKTTRICVVVLCLNDEDRNKGVVGGLVCMSIYVINNFNYCENHKTYQPSHTLDSSKQ